MPPHDLTGLRILVVDDEHDIRLGLRKLIESLGATVHDAPNGVEALHRVTGSGADLVLTDLMMPEMGGAELLAEIKRHSPSTTVVILTGFGTVPAAVSCLQGGASHFLTKPFDNDEILGVVGRLGAQILASRDTGAAGGVVAEDPKMRDILALIDRVAPTPAPVLIEGESGSGKEVVARLLHARSQVAKRPFIAVDTGAVSDSLLESELFGHVRGAFTGAEREHAGLFAAATGGTVFLDEVASMSTPFQAKLLRVLQEKVVRPVGGTEDVRVDFRLIAASNRDLAQLVGAGGFREDLFYRLRVVNIRIPPLRDRRADIIPLARLFLAKASASCLSEAERHPDFAADALDLLLSHDWPGNVRQLENAVQRAVIVCGTSQIRPHHLGLDTGAWTEAGTGGDQSYDTAKKRVVERFQREFVVRALERTRGNVSHAAETCGMTRAALQRILRQLEIDRSAFE